MTTGDDPVAVPGRQTAAASARLTIMTQSWCDIAFLHWRVDPGLVAPLLPPGLRPDTLAGATYVGLIPFRMVGAGVGRGPGVPWLGDFLELNVRLYTRDGRDRPGVYFASLETQRLAVVLGARAVFGIRYFWAGMRLRRRADGTMEWASRRRWPGPAGALSRIVVRPGAPIARPTAEELFVTARFEAHSHHLGLSLSTPNEHEPWRLRRAELLDLQDDLVAVAGLPGLTGRPPDSVMFSEGTATRFVRPHVRVPATAAGPSLRPVAGPSLAMRGVSRRR